MKNHSQPQSSLQFNSVLRLLGAVSVTASGAVFLLQGLESLSSFQRFLSFGAITLIMAIFGILIGTKWSEGKSARTFLALSAAATPVLFSQLGSMLHGLFNFGLTAETPKFLDIQAPSFLAVGLTLMTSALVLTPILYLGFASFFRSRAKQLVLLMLAGSTLLLLPSRDSDVAALLILVQAAFLSYFATKAQKKSHADTESVVASLLPFIPAMIMIGRQVYYSTSDLFFTALLLLAAGFFHETVPSLDRNEKRMALAKTWGLVFLALSWIPFSGLLLTTGFPFLQASVGVRWMIHIYPVAIGLMMVSAAKHPSHSPLLRLATDAASIFVPVLACVLSFNLETAVVQLVVGSMAMAIGYSFRRKAAFQSGVLTIGLGLFYLISEGLHLVTIMPWLSLAVFGILAIGLAAWLEKQRPRLSEFRQSYQLYFQEGVIGEKTTPNQTNIEQPF